MVKTRGVKLLLIVMLRKLRTSIVDVLASWIKKIVNCLIFSSKGWDFHKLNEYLDIWYHLHQSHLMRKSAKAKQESKYVQCCSSLNGESCRPKVKQSSSRYQRLKCISKMKNQNGLGMAARLTFLESMEGSESGAVWIYLL